MLAIADGEIAYLSKYCAGLKTESTSHQQMFRPRKISSRALNVCA